MVSQRRDDIYNGYTIGRSVYAIIRWLKFPIAFALASLALCLGLFLTQALPLVVTIILTVILAIISYIIIAVNYRDWNNERYEVTADGELRLYYKNALRYTSIRQGDITRLTDAYAIRRGFKSHLFNYGDVYVQVSWSKLPFVLRDVQNPNQVKDDLKMLAAYYGNHRENNEINILEIRDGYEQEG